MKERDYFLQACFTDDLQQFYKDWINEKADRIQYFIESNGLLEHRQWKPSKICRSLGEELTIDNIDIAVGYWTPFLWFPIRKDFKVQHQKNEAYECQKIDCSCNDCIFLNRDEKWCMQLEKEITIQSNLCHPQNQECFVHRLDNKEE